ncbi:phenylalanine--tRNA ligase subunit beta [Propionicicella superfundia]|uniref:phenylalanine--tRNA ligase subunit beta n=1 Tax=Propionicicella superfundia TaxID=348582 RepID=UPI000410D483|nr:phenylalanine--tRNA ligase subunit beta [Propionicicella superfundia]
MRAPLSWLREYADLPEDITGRELAEVLIRAGLEVETVDEFGADLDGPLVIGRVLDFVEEPQKNGKTIRWCHVDVGEHNGPEGNRGIVCGALNFDVGDHVVVALPGTTLPGGFQISARKTYGHISDGMICAEDELGIGDDHTGIWVLGEANDAGVPWTPGVLAVPALGLRDDVLDIAVTPDLGYCFSIRGLAREAAQALEVRFRDPVAKPVPTAVADGYPIDLRSENCPLFVALGVDGVDPGRPSPIWMKLRLRQAGMRSISLAVDITNYVMLETGQPLHAYDAERLAGPIVVRQAGTGETLVTLDDVTRQLDPDDLLIVDDSGPIGLAGVMGGESTELRESTTRIVVEAAQFASGSIARTSRRHKLGSEAAKRFERGVDPAAAYAAAHRVAELLASLAGGTVSEAETVVGAVSTPPRTSIQADLPTRVLGMPVSRERVIEILEASGVDVVALGDTLTLTPPTWRPDLRDPYDYVEEVGRKTGLDLLPSVVPAAPVGRGLTRAQRLRRQVDAALVGAGFVEVLCFPFLGTEALDRLQVPADDQRRRLARLENPLADTEPYLRTTLLPGLLAAVARNTSRGNTDLALFETGSVFLGGQEAFAPLPSVDGRPSDEELAAIQAALPVQPTMLGGVVTGEWVGAGWQGPAVAAGWQQVVDAVQVAGRAVGLELTPVHAELAPWHPGRCARFEADGRVLGYAGELHPTVCEAMGVPARTAAFEIVLDTLLTVAPGAGSLDVLSTHPIAKEDVALIVSADVPAADVATALRAGAGELLESLALFDVYEGPQVGEGKKSLAYALRFRAPDRTLKDAETAAARDAAVATAAERFGAVQRTL